MLGWTGSHVSLDRPRLAVDLFLSPSLSAFFTKFFSFLNAVPISMQFGVEILCFLRKDGLLFTTITDNAEGKS